MLLKREKTTALRAIERVVGLQAQVARPPFIGLWSRVEGFKRQDLIRLLQSRKVVRATMMRCTLHLMSAKDFIELRTALQPALTAAMNSIFRNRPNSVDHSRMLDAAQGYFARKPSTFNDLRAFLLEHFPNGDERAMGYAVRTQLPLVQVPTEVEWGFPASSDFTLADVWLGKALSTEQRPDDLVLRYLAGYGPASPKDMQTWAGLVVGEAFERLRPKLKTFRDEQGKELFDLPKSPRPETNTPAPVRFIPDYDNLVLSHANRTRVIADEHRPALVTRNLQVRATFLVDGFVAGTWRIERTKGSAMLVIEPFDKLSGKASGELMAEGKLLLSFCEPDAARVEVQIKRVS
jgi:hypothetical protein